MIRGYRGEMNTAYLDKVDVTMYRCPVCGAEMPVAEEYDLIQRMWYPVQFADTACPVCDEEWMDRKG